MAKKKPKEKLEETNEASNTQKSQMTTEELRNLSPEQRRARIQRLLDLTIDDNTTIDDW